jgi:hypothetical protein
VWDGEGPMRAEGLNVRFSIVALLLLGEDLSLTVTAGQVGESFELSACLPPTKED